MSYLTTLNDDYSYFLIPKKITYSCFLIVPIFNSKRLHHSERSKIYFQLLLIRLERVYGNFIE